MFLRSDRTLRRKFQEALLAGILEFKYDKAEILEAYLNEIYLGQRHGYAIMGVGEAAEVWFGKDVRELSPAESALLAGAIHAPNRTVPWKHPERAKRRRDQVLEKMRALELLPADQIDAALATAIESAPGEEGGRRAPWFVDSAVAELEGRYAPEALHREGLELVTTLDSRMQDAAEAALRQGLEQMRSSYPDLWTDESAPQVALIAMDPSSGAIRAMVGGSDYSKSQFNRVTQAHRQPGSAFKPIVLAAALGESWPDLGPQSRVRDRPLRLPIRSESGSEWSPRNHDDRFLGSISLRKATETSRNPPFVRLALDIGIERVQSVAKAMGITSPIPALPSVAIGSAELTPLELATAYSTLANGGLRPEAHCLVGIRDLEGEWLERSMPRTTAAIDPRVAAVVTDMLEGVVERGTARSVRGGGLAIPLAGKTGTSNGSRDAWMAGYSSDLTVVVWVGFDEARTLGMSSTQAAVPIWADFMERIEPYLAGDSFDLPRGARELIARGGPARNDVERQRELEIEDSAMRDLEDAEMGTRRR